LLGGIFVGLVLWFRKTKNGALLGAPAWILLPLVPVSYIRIFHRDDFVHDRYLYISIVGVSILFVLLGQLIEKSKISFQHPFLTATVMTGVLALFGIFCVSQAAPWESNLTLYSNAMRVAPGNMLARNNLASEYATRGRYLEANEILKPLLMDRPNFWQANYNYGYCNYKLNNLALAEEYFLRAIAIDPANSDQYVYLGTTYFKENRLYEAAEQIQKGIARRPDGVGYHFALGIVNLNLGKLAAAKQEMQAELQYHPGNAAAALKIQEIDQKIANSFR